MCAGMSIKLFWVGVVNTPHLRRRDHDVPVLWRGQVVDGAHQVDGLGAGLLRLGGRQNGVRGTRRKGVHVRRESSVRRKGVEKRGGREDT